MILKIKPLSFTAGRPISIINSQIAGKIPVHIGERILISKYGDSIISIIDTSLDLVKTDELAVSKEIIESLKVNEGDEVEVILAPKPKSTSFIKKKLNGEILSRDEIFMIIRDIVDNALTEAEIAYFVSAVYQRGMTEQETKNLVDAMVSTGKRLNFKGEIVDKHSIGGIAGNRTTPLVVSICTSLGLIMPKTSSRAITSAAGTADVIESISRVEFTSDEIERIVSKVGGCMVWNGILNLSPADDKLIQVEKIINIDPEPQLLASVLSKKIAVGSKYVLIDIPFGKNAKVDKKSAIKLKDKFERIGSLFGLNLKAVLTKGNEPIGHGIGPLLEIRDILRVFENHESCPKDLKDKACFLAGELLELSGKAGKGKGKKLAEKSINSGIAFNKFKEIIKAQSGHVPSSRQIDSRLGRFRHDILSSSNSIIKSINNKSINKIATVAGSPVDNGAGLYIYKHEGSKIKKGEKLFTIYSESELRLKSAIKLVEETNPILY
jgi:AMP phosphorylase